MTNTYIKKFNNTDKILKIIYHSILNYYNWHKEKYKLNCPNIEKYLETYKYLKDDYENNQIGGIRKITKTIIMNDLKNYDTFL